MFKQQGFPWKKVWRCISPVIIPTTLVCVLFGPIIHTYFFDLFSCFSKRRRRHRLPLSVIYSFRFSGFLAIIGELPQSIDGCGSATNIFWQWILRFLKKILTNILALWAINRQLKNSNACSTAWWSLSRFYEHFYLLLRSTDRYWEVSW